MLGFLKTLFSSSRFMSRLADEIGVDRKLYKAALTEVGVNFAYYEAYYNGASKENDARIDILCLLAVQSIPETQAGAAQMLIKFPLEQERFGRFLTQIDDFLASAKAQEVIHHMNGN